MLAAAAAVVVLSVSLPFCCCYCQNKSVSWLVSCTSVTDRQTDRQTFEKITLKRKESECIFNVASPSVGDLHT